MFKKSFVLLFSLAFILLSCSSVLAQTKKLAFSIEGFSLQNREFEILELLRGKLLDRFNLGNSIEVIRSVAIDDSFGIWLKQGRILKIEGQNANFGQRRVERGMLEIQCLTILGKATQIIGPREISFDRPRYKWLIFVKNKICLALALVNNHLGKGWRADHFVLGNYKALMYFDQKLNQST